MASPADLKAQGNALFGAKDFAEAEKKYTGAIEASDDDGKALAVLYANRAACRLSMKRYMDADTDAKKATILDPTYAKAFARLATAQERLGNFPESKENWQRALDALPKTNLKPAEEVQKTQYEAGLQAATAALIKAQNTVLGQDGPGPGNGIFIVEGKGRMPWDLAAAMIPRLKLQRPTATSPELYSSAWVINGAYTEFMEAVRKMSQLQMIELPLGHKLAGMLGVVTGLRNGIMRDSRVMHFPDAEFITKYNKQVTFEAQAYRAWTEGGPEVVIREALARQRTEGWKATRPALSVTVRAWIMRGMIDSNVYTRHHVAVEFYKNCLDVIRTLREHWILESKDDRGVIFEKTFVFGIQQLYLDSIMQSYAVNESASSTEVLEDLLKESELLIREIDEALRQPPSTEPVDPGFISSFYLYPKGQAYAMKGFYYNKMAMKNGNDPLGLFRKAALEYISAAKSFPEDDEKHPYFLNVALQNMFKSRSFQLRETLDVMKRIRVAIPKTLEIWERSSLSAAGVADMFQRTAKQEQELRDMVAAGKFSLDACLGVEPA
ncbi:hypothetical protein K438DRAFT_1727120 [Mycena galopus ATCC 62051]|nr:hypothetical protein K438DRAFT_1727120 [Mycena galopus ATCC 62051]